MNKLSIPMLLLLVSGLAQAKVVTSDVEYKVEGKVMQGYLAYDDSVSGKRPGILIVHEWWGHNDYARKRARMLAELGYVAFSLDMYGKGKVADHPGDAGKFKAEVEKNQKLKKKRFTAALAQLKKNAHTDASQIAAVGYCFGGGVVLEMMRQGVKLDAVVSFHGGLTTSTPARKKDRIKSRVLVLNGAADKFVKPEQITAFKKEMEQAGIQYRFVNYPDAVHAFTNPAATENGKKFNIPIAYNRAADEKSWVELQNLLNEVFKKPSKK